MMVSDSLGRLADVMFLHATRGTAPTPEECAAITGEMLDAARAVAVLETLPIEVTMELLRCLPEAWLARVAAGAGA